MFKNFTSIYVNKILKLLEKFLFGLLNVDRG